MYGISDRRCNQDEKTSSVREQRVGDIEGWHGFSAEMHGLRAAGDGVQEACGKEFQGICEKSLRLKGIYGNISTCDI